MKTKIEILNFFKQNRLFQENEYLYEIFPELSEYQSQIVNGNEFKDFILLMYALDDNTERFDITQAFNEGIKSFYFKNNELFIKCFLENIEVIYPHAIDMAKDILYLILREPNAKGITCKYLDNIETYQKKIFKEIYSQMIVEDKTYLFQCISTKLNI